MTILLLPAKRYGGSQQRGAAGSRALLAAAVLIASGREQAGFAMSILEYTELSEFCASFVVLISVVSNVCFVQKHVFRLQIG